MDELSLSGVLVVSLHIHINYHKTPLASLKNPYVCDSKLKRQSSEK